MKFCNLMKKCSFQILLVACLLIAENTLRLLTARDGKDWACGHPEKQFVRSMLPLKRDFSLFFWKLLAGNVYFYHSVNRDCESWYEITETIDTFQFWTSHSLLTSSIFEQVHNLFRYFCLSLILTRQYKLKKILCQ